MDLSAYKAISIGGIAMKKLTLDGVQIWKSGPTNWVRKSINADGTIYNGGLGYKNGYRIRSGGAEATSAAATITGFIKVSPGDVIRISGCNFGYASNTNALNAADASFANIGQFTSQPSNYGIFHSGYDDYDYLSVVKEKDGVWKWIVPPEASGVAYIRVTACYSASTGTAPPGEDLIITINEEI